MADTIIIPERFWLRRGTREALRLTNEVLYKGEFCVEYDLAIGPASFKVKVGDGSSTWNELPYLCEADKSQILGIVSLRF
jgi:hypothetical protein